MPPPLDIHVRNIHSNEYRFLTILLSLQILLNIKSYIQFLSIKIRSCLFDKKTVCFGIEIEHEYIQPTFPYSS
jgi:hypothetical protein